ncbi:hypothetical protein DFJ74DRAFT_667771 [Hyaloraphidium curvatum]|nr:hypothetical protein DFJ74DRAFT_667771 [Hyaloraphidium curvatum]
MRYVTRKLWERNRSCTVCFEDLPQGAVPPPPASDSEYDKVVVRMPCSHLFHLPCLAPWLRNQSNACPACRYELPTGDPAFDAGVGERMALWKVDPEPEGNAVEVRAEMMGLPSEEEEEEPAEEPESDGCEMRRVVGRCLRAPQGTPALAAELAAAEGIPVPAGAEIRGTDAIDAWNRSLREMAGCGHRFHAECLAGLLSVRGYAMPTSGEEVRCPVCRKVGTVRAVGEQVDGMEVEQDETRKRKAGEDWVGGAEELLRVVRSMARDDGSHVVIADLD